MRLKSKIVLLAVVPLLASIVLIALAVRHQERALAARERELVESAYMSSKRTELRHYVELARSTIAPLYDSGDDSEATRQAAMKLLASLDYGTDGYFFLYDLQGRSLMHPRQPELVGNDLWELRDEAGHPTIQQLIAKASEGGGFIDYLWRKPSTRQTTPKLGYVIALPRWNWMLGTGLYLDDVQATMAQLDHQVAANIETTFLWIAGIALSGIALITVCGLALNLSEHKEADAKLRQLAQQVVQSQESERAHLSRELHDGTSQTLVSIKLLIESAIEQIEREPAQAAVPLERAAVRLADALTEVRRISHRLRPAMLDVLGLPAALEHLGREFGDHSGLAFSMRMRGPSIELPDDVKTVLFRVTQEALTNIEKHAAAQSVRIRLAFRPSGLRLAILDDGRGFDLAAVQLDPRRGIGLRNMRERLASIGGSFRIRSRSGLTELVADVPEAQLRRLKEA
ncbi:cache domain-containing protein [Methylibium petroleiphilum]|uniref:cache domain-containing protein n=1 Tax=Methylibium petroleiphilum TaxID=105560 RepID=UPI001AD09B41|nr:cache domain-containing protein [Methylibium petroleiphilum]MBN9203478.1 cache domain-containing protein [Methylibium petroleiphilum]